MGTALNFPMLLDLSPPPHSAVFHNRQFNKHKPYFLCFLQLIIDLGRGPDSNPLGTLPTLKKVGAGGKEEQDG